MYINNEYINNSLIDTKDKTKPLIVTSCGTYHLFTRPKLPTWRPKGRVDFQLLYIASGKAHFHFGEKEEIVTAGHMVLFRPREPQRYEYYGIDQPEVYWVHFTGGNVKNLLRAYGLTDEKRVFYCGSDLEYKKHFRAMIQELQMCREDYPHPSIGKVLLCNNKKVKSHLRVLTFLLFNDWVILRLLHIILCLGIPKLIIFPSLIRHQLLVGSLLDYRSFMEYRNLIAEPTGR